MKNLNTYPQDSVFSHLLAVITKDNQRIYDFKKESNLNNVRVIGVQCRKRDTEAVTRSHLGYELVNNDVFHGSFLKIRKGNTDVHERIPLSLIQEHTINNPGIGFPLNLTQINISDSGVEVAQDITVAADEAFEFLFVYQKI